MKARDFLKNRNAVYNILTVLLAISISLVIALFIVLITSKNPWAAMNAFITGPLSSISFITSIVIRASMLIFSGLAVAVMFRAGQFNMGTEGAIYLGGVAATAIALSLNLPPILHLIVIFMTGALAGGIFSGLPGILKYKWGANEFVTSIILNYASLYIGLFIINHFFFDPNSNTFGSKRIPVQLLLPKIAPNIRIHSGLIIMLVTLILVCLLLLKSKQGYQMTIMGINSEFARYSGMNTGFLLVLSQFIGGALAGIGGAVEVLGVYMRFQWSSLPGYGWDGVIVAILARNNPVMIPLAALFISYLRTGSDIMATRSDVPAQIITVIQAVMIIFITSSALLDGLRKRSVVKEVLKK